ncbi:hypothetical protein ACKFKF_29715 [Phormidesmis sp. 146-12]
MKNAPVTDLEVSQVSIVTQNHKAPTLQTLLDLVDDLPDEDQSALLEKLIGKQADNGLSVVFGNNQIRGSIVVQINQAPPAELAVILNVIAERIKRQGL